MEERPLFVSDVDNTLLWSVKHKRENDICVEQIREKDQGFMSPRVLELLPRVCRETLLIPLTTRSEEQYLRIRFPEGGTPRLAAVANGAVLLRNGQPDAEWRRDSEALIGPWREELGRMRERLSSSERYIRCRVVDDAYLFVYCDKGIEPREEARRLGEETSLSVTAAGKKIYLLPPLLHKGTAFERLRQRFPSAPALCAGDGEMDVPMLERADIALLPDGLPCAPDGKTLRWNGEGRFAEFVLAGVLRETEEAPGIG